MKARTKPMRARASARAAPMMKFVNRRPPTSGWRAVPTQQPEAEGGPTDPAVAGEADAEAGADGGQAIADELQRSNDEYSFHSFLL